MKQEFKGELVPKMPASFSDAVDKAVFTAIGKENQETVRREKGTARGKKLRRYGAAAAAVVLLMVTAFTLGLGVYGNTFGALSSQPKATGTRLDTIPLYSDPIPNVTRYDLTEGYAYADALFDLVQEDLAWLKETSYDELWLLGVVDLSKADFSSVVCTGTESETDWKQPKNTLFALVQFEFGEGDGPMLVEFGLDEGGKPVSSTIKVLSCDPELDGTFSYNVEDYTSPYAYVGYGAGANKGQLTSDNYTMAIAPTLPLEQIIEKLSTSAHQSHAREWYLYTAPAQCARQLWTGDQQEKVVCSGPVIKQTRSFSSDIGLRATVDGETQYSAGKVVPEGMDEEQTEDWIKRYIQSLSWAFEKNDSRTFLLHINLYEEPSLVLETNLADFTLKNIFAYNSLRMEWYEETISTVEELLHLTSESGENVICLYGESEGQEYVIGFSAFYHASASTYVQPSLYPLTTTDAKRYDLTGGYEHADELLDEVETYLQKQGEEYDELWLEAVYELEKVDYTLLSKQYGKQMWMENYTDCYALVQYDFSEGAGPMLVYFDYSSNKELFRFYVVKSTVDPNVDMFYGSIEGEDSYAVSYKYKCMGTGASSGMIMMDKAVLKFTSQLPLEQVQELVKDSPHKDAAREWYFCLAPAIGDVTLYDENGQERSLRNGYELYGEEAYERTWEGYCVDFNVYEEEQELLPVTKER